MTTPAQAYGHPNFVTDVATQGPTDKGLRAADCKYAQTVLPAQPACADCKGPIPMWAQQKFSLSEQISFAGTGVAGFALEAPGVLSGSDVWASLNADQQAWVASTFAKLNDMIVKTTGTTCPTWGPSVTAASSCFKPWYNAMYVGSPGFVKLGSDNTFDADTLQALITTALIHQNDFPTPFPGTPPKAGLSKGAMAGIAAAVAAVGGGLVYVATHKKTSRRKRG